MKKTILLVSLLSSLLAKGDIQKAFVVAIFANNKGENVQHKTITDLNYTGDIISKVAIIGKYNKNTKVVVKINNSFGKLISSEPLYNDINKSVFGYELTFKHENVEKGYFEVYVDDKLYDTKVFIK